MRKVNNLGLPKKLAVFVTSKNFVTTAVTHRSAILTNMSGYPIASHVVGRLQRKLKLGSSKELMQSILELRDLVRLASDILKTMLLAKLDRAQMIRTEVIAYVSQNAENYGMRNLSEDDLDFVAYLITSSESHDASWILDMPNDPNDNLICKVSNLYRSMSHDISVDYDGTEVTAAASEAFAVYRPSSNTIVSVNETASAQAIVNSYKVAVTGMKDKNLILNHQFGTTEQLGYLHNINALAMIRIIDHVFALLTNVDLWKRMISPRKTNDASQNEERADSLKVLASYFHSLLMYPHIFSIELFRSTYDKIQDWLIPFPALPAHVIAQYDEIVKKYDILGAESDVQNIINSLTVSNDTNLETHITGFLVEFAAPFNMSPMIAAVRRTLENTLTPIAFDGLKALKEEKYTYLLMAHPVGEFDMSTGVAEAVLIESVVSKKISEACNAIVPATTKFYSEGVLTSLKAMSLRVGYPLVSQLAFSDEVNTTTSATLVNNRIHYRPLSPQGTYDYQFHVKRDMMFNVFKAQDLIAQSKFMPTHIINTDLAAELRKVMGYEWKSLMPSNICYGDKIYTKEILKADKEEIRQFIEKVANIPYDLIVRTIANQFIRERWATILSSCALLYVFPSTADIDSIAKSESKGSMASFLVEGFGKPYGTNYKDLASKQPPLTKEDLIELAPSVYMRLLKNIPLPKEKLLVEPSFYMQHPYYYYPANSETLEVTKWVFAEGLLHMAMCPILGKYEKPIGLLDKRYAYANDILMMQMDLGYVARRDVDQASDFTAAITTHNWPYDRFKQYIEYRRLSVYGAEAATPAETAESLTPIADLVTKIEKSETDAEQASTVARLDEASTNIVHENEVQPVINKEKPKNDKKKKDQSSDTKEKDETSSEDKEDEKDK